jgi:hypothetical protein
MKNLFLALVIAVQTYYLWALYDLFVAVVTALSKFGGGDATLVAGTISEGIITSVLRSTVGAIGLIASVVIVFKVGGLPIWYKQTTKYISYLWVLFIPVGTILGIVQLKRLSR